MKLTLAPAAIILALSFAAVPAQLAPAKPKVINNPYFRPSGPAAGEEEQKAQQRPAADEAGQQHLGDQRLGQPPKGLPRPSRN